MRLVRNPYFRVWSRDARPPGFADRIVVRANQDIDAQVAAVQRGRADVVTVAGPFGGTLAPERIRALTTRDAARLHNEPTPELDFMFLNARTPPFDDVRVRRALNYAVDRRRVTRLAGGRAVAQPSCQLVPPGFPGYAPACRYTLDAGPSGAWIAPDMPRARRLIRRSGTQGMNVTVWGYQDKRGIIRYFAGLLRRLGYRTSIRLFGDYGIFNSHVTDPRTRAQIGIEGYSADVAAPSQFTSFFTCASFSPRSISNANVSEFCDHTLDARMDAARQARGAQADALWSDVFQRLADAAPAVPLVNRRTLVLVSNRVGNYQSHPMLTTLLDQLWVR